MSLGVPVVASAVGGLPEIVEHQQTGLLTGNDERSIAHAMRRILRGTRSWLFTCESTAFAAVKETIFAGAYGTRHAGFIPEGDWILIRFVPFG